jgi:hypothetical protein
MHPPRRKTAPLQELSIEHEDIMVSLEEGFHKAALLLKTISLKEEYGKTWWDS